jgi:hypothetical protein
VNITPHTHNTEALSAWRALRPYLQAPVRENLEPPPGYAHPHDPTLYPDPNTELSALIATQLLDLAPERTTLAAQGFEVISMNHRGDDFDEDLAANIAEAHLDTTPYTIDPTFYPVLRRIEWEQYLLNCSLPTKFWIEDRAGRRVLCANRRVDTDTLRSVAARLPDDLPPRRESHGSAWDRLTPELQADWLARGPQTRAYLEPATTPDPATYEDRPRPLPRTANYELGLHDPAYPFEPPDSYLWPETAGKETE